MNPSLELPSHLASSYRACGRITRNRSSSYWLATNLLPRDRRPYVHSLYAFARTADDIVDRPGGDPAGALAIYRSQLRSAVNGVVPDGHPELDAVAHTIDVWELSLDAVDRFFRSMEMDLTVAGYDTWDDLLGYMDGSAAVIGELMLPILDPSDAARALGPARDLGLAFQLTNFLRDIDEDLDRGRQYVPREDLERFGVELTDRRVTPGFVDLMEFEIARCRRLYRSADAGVALLPPRSARCVRLASALYESILDRIQRHGYDVFAGRARVPRHRKVRLVAATLVRH